MRGVLHFRNLLVFFCAFFVALSSVIALPLVTNAQGEDPQQSITLSPVRKNYEVTAGETFTDFITILNDGTTAYDFIVYATPYSVNNTAYEADFLNQKPNANFNTWVTFEKTTYHAEPRETIKVPYTVTVKKDASPGGHYGAIFAEVQPQESQSGTSIGINRRVGSLMYATVAGDVKLAGQSQQPVINWYQSTPPLTAIAPVKNTGNTDFFANVSYTVKNIFGNVKYTMQNDYAVLPQTTRDIPLVWEDASWFGLYNVSIKTTVLGESTTHDGFVLLMPSWLIVALGLAGIGGALFVYIRQLRKHRK